MKLSVEKISEIAVGASRVSETEYGIELLRFTAEQEQLYKYEKPEFINKTFCTAGVRLHFKTDSCNLFIKVNVSEGATRSYFSFDVVVNGKPCGYLDNFSDITLCQNIAQTKCPYGKFSKSFELGEGIKDVCVYFPWSVRAVLEELSLDDNAVIEPIKRSKNMLIFGDSITHGYDALRPSLSYASQLSDALNADAINKAIGGEVFFPSLAKLSDDIKPDYITVAYGTNDWNLLERENFCENCKGFFSALKENYSKALIFAVSPIWRKDTEPPRKFGDFSLVEQDIKEITESLGGIIFISGRYFVPENEEFFGDMRLHPNIKGFEHYFNNLYGEIKKYIV